MKTEKHFTDMQPEEFKKYGRELIDWIANYLDGVEKYPVLPDVKPGEIKSKLPGTAPENSEPMESILADVDKIILPGVTHWQHPGFMAYFNSTASGPGILGELLSAAFNTNGMVWKSNPASTELEETVLIWFRQLMNLPESFSGIIYDTASVSSMHAIAAARENLNLKIREKGMSGISKLMLYCSEHAHSSIEKGALTLGIGLDGVTKIAVDPEFKMIPAELEKAIQRDRVNGIIPFCVVATIGTTSTTSVDPLNEIAGICEREKIWLHVDGAHAGVTAMLPEMSSHFRGLERADSFVVNPHKWLTIPVDLSILFTRKPEILKRAFSLVPEYLKTAEDPVVINYMDYGIQLGRRFRALKLWFVLRYFGVNGLRKMLREHLRLGKLFASWVEKHSMFELLAPTPFSTICFRATPNGWNNEIELNLLNEKLMNEINSTGKLFVTHTKLNGTFTIRLVISGLRQQERHVKAAWQLIQDTLNKILNEG